MESESNSASATPMDVDAVGKGKGKGCFVCGRLGHAAKDCKFNQANGKTQGKGKAKNTPLDTNTPAKFEGECRHCGKKGQVGRLSEALGRSERQESPRRRWSTVNSNGGGSGRHGGDR